MSMPEISSIFRTVERRSGYRKDRLLNAAPEKTYGGTTSPVFDVNMKKSRFSIDLAEHFREERLYRD